MNPQIDATLKALNTFAEGVTAKFEAHAHGSPEDQLRAPLESLLQDVGTVLSHTVVAKDQSRLPDRTGIPDYAAVVDSLLAGYVELKAPGKGADPSNFTGHDREQWQRFSALPNILYTDGNKWALYHNGERAGQPVEFSGDVSAEGRSAVRREDAELLLRTLAQFFAWEPTVPSSAPQLATLLAPLCRVLRDEVLEALGDPSSPLTSLADDWRDLLFPEANDKQFADAYAQTVTYALLLSKAEDGNVLEIGEAANALKVRSSLLARALQVLTDDPVQKEIATSFRVLQRVIDKVDPKALSNGQDDPWLYFYEDFLTEYDPKLRKDAGIFFTDVEVVRCQVRLIDQLLKDDLSLKHGFANDDVVTLDPGVGTGTYHLGVVDHALEEIRKREGEGAVPARATALADNLHGFELMVGPYAVAELRLSQQLQDFGATLSSDLPHIHLTDTLESPQSEPKAPPLFLKPLAEEHKRALEVKESTRVLVCLGNPPYDRHAADDSSKGGWVRHGSEAEDPILNDFTDPVKKSGLGHHLKNIYNLYVYFWRWALWKVFEHDTSTGPGVVSFISASSYLQGDAFRGMRQKMRRLCDKIWIIDLGGEQRGTRKSDNVFPSVRTPVAIAVAARFGKPNANEPAQVQYADMREGTREEKLQRLDAVSDFSDVEWTECPSGWQDPFLPAGTGEYFTWPRLTEVFPWQHTGAEIKRTWPIAPDHDTLHKRWTKLLTAQDQKKAFKETRDRKLTKSYLPLIGSRSRLAPIKDISEDAAPPPIVRYGWRSFDRQWIFADSRLGDFMRPVLWNTHGDAQLYMSSLFHARLDHGPSLTVTAHVPDRHYFCNRGGKDIIPLWRNASATEPNILPGLLDLLSCDLGHAVVAEDLAAYCYGILAHDGYVERYFDELGAPDPDQGTVPPRVPITRDRDLFHSVVKVGRRLIWLHTYGTRWVPPGESPNDIPAGQARCVTPVPNAPDQYPEAFSYDPSAKTLTVGKGEFAPVSPEILKFSVSGLLVVESWLGYRMREPAGKKTSPLDAITPERWTAKFTEELLELLWVIEHTLNMYPDQKDLLDRVVLGPVFSSADLPTVPDEARDAPSFSREEASVEQIEHLT